MTVRLRRRRCAFWFVSEGCGKLAAMGLTYDDRQTIRWARDSAVRARLALELTSADVRIRALKKITAPAGPSFRRSGSDLVPQTSVALAFERATR